MVHSEAISRFDDVTKKTTKNQPSNTLISWVNIEMLYFTLSRERMMVELSTAISVSVRFGNLFLHAFGTTCFFAGIDINHVARPVESDLPINTMSVYLSVRPSVSNLSI